MSRIEMLVKLDEAERLLKEANAILSKMIFDGDTGETAICDRCGKAADKTMTDITDDIAVTQIRLLNFKDTELY